MILRLAKVLLVFGIACYLTLVVFNNVADYGSNLQFVRHVLMMDSTFPGNAGMWRAINSPAIHTLFYISIIGWEALTMLVCWVGGVQMARAVRGTADEFHRAKRAAIAGLALSLLLWLLAFLTVGGEWFLMWQSKSWNGQEAAFRMFTVMGIVLLLVAQKDQDTQP